MGVQYHIENIGISSVESINSCSLMISWYIYDMHGLLILIKLYLVGRNGKEMEKEMECNND